jgi:hypothetical protein
MPVSTSSYVPLLVSERLAPNAAGRFDLCRAAVLAMLLNITTNGEWMTKPNGRDWGRKRMTQLLESMRRATGEVNRGSYNQGHVSAFERGAGWSSTYEMANEQWPEIVAGLKSGRWAYDLAGDVKHTPDNSPLRKYVSPYVGHDILLLKLSKDGKRIAFIDPMTPPGTKAYVRWAPVGHFRLFAQEFKYAEERVVAGRVRKGENTDANKVRRNWRRAVQEQGAQIIELKQQVVNKQQKVDALRDDKAELVQATEGQADVINKLDGLLVAANEALRQCEEADDPNVVEQLEAEVDMLEDAMIRIRAISNE